MRKPFSKITLAAGISLALAFTFSCEKDKGDDGDDTGDISSSSTPSSSSSGGKSSSSGKGIIPGPSVNHGGEIYETVVIGTQTWFKRNLNYNVSGSVCYDKKAANCDTYGRMYEWEAAMSACPSGFHIPTVAEWDVLISFVEKDKGCKGCAGKLLKAKSGWNWNDLNNISGDGTDDYGFAALPSGYGYSTSYFSYLGEIGFWWSSSIPTADVGGAHAHYQDIDYNLQSINLNEASKGVLLSVRCLQNNGNTSSSSSVKSSSSSSVSSSSSSSSSSGGVVYGESVTYEGETYKTIVIGTQTWFQRNLNYAVEGSKCYSNQESNCAIYGRLYNWATAMALPDSCNKSFCSTSQHRGICPIGWHIPSNDDWDKLMRYVDGSIGTSSPYNSPTAGKYLKATTGWNNNGNGQDTYGFSALPNGYASPSGGFYLVGDRSHWWSINESTSDGAYRLRLYYNSERTDYDNVRGKTDLISIRCIKN